MGRKRRNQPLSTAKELQRWEVQRAATGEDDDGIDDAR